MHKKHKQALAVCFNKKKKISEHDLRHLFMTPHVRANVLKFFHEKGYLKPSDISGYWDHVPDATTQIVEVLSK